MENVFAGKIAQISLQNRDFVNVSSPVPPSGDLFNIVPYWGGGDWNFVFYTSEQILYRNQRIEPVVENIAINRARQYIC